MLVGRAVQVAVPRRPAVDRDAGDAVGGPGGADQLEARAGEGDVGLLGRAGSRPPRAGVAARVGVRGPGPLVDHARVGVVEAGEHLIACAVDRLGVVQVVGALPLQGVAARGVGQHDCRAARPVPTVDAPHGRRDA